MQFDFSWIVVSIKFFIWFCTHLTSWSCWFLLVSAILIWPGSDVLWDGPLVAGVGFTLVAGCWSPPPGGVPEVVDPVSDSPSFCCKSSWCKQFTQSHTTLSVSKVGTVSKKSVISNTSFVWILHAKATAVPFDNAIGSLELFIILHNPVNIPKQGLYRTCMGKPVQTVQDLYLDCFVCISWNDVIVA